MPAENLIPADEFCIHHKIESSFIYSLSESGLLQVTSIDEKIYIPSDQVGDLEKMVRLYYELGINLEGIETIHHIMDRMTNMQHKITELRNRLSRYEED